MSTILDTLRQRHGLPTTRGNSTMQADGKDIPMRMNYMTCGNTVELITESIHKLVRRKNGLTDMVGEQRLLKRDIAAMVGNRLAKRIEAVAQNKQG